jgi:glycosyltransferase involved in cell wall biosynthesis
MEQDILVSILLTSYNRKGFVAAAIESILASTYRNFEFIICDDCSVDGTYEIEQQYAAKDHRIKLFRNEQNLGDFPNRDKAASYASGKYLKYVDSDDIIHPDGLQKMIDSMLLFPDAVLGLSQIETDLNKEKEYPILVNPERAYQEHFYGYGTLRYGPTGAIIKKAVLVEMGGFGTNRFVGDTELWLKIVASYPLVKIEPGLVEWQRHEGQEFDYGMRNDIYIQKAYQVYLASLESPDCPLNQHDIKKIKRRLRWKHARDILSIAFKKGKFKMAMQIFSEADFGIVQLMQGLKPYSRVKKNFQKSL